MLTIIHIGKLRGYTLLDSNSTRWHCDMVASTNESYGFQFKCVGTGLVRNQHLVGTTTVIELHRELLYDKDFSKRARNNCVYEIKNMRDGNSTYAKLEQINTINKFGKWLCKNTL